MESGILTLKQVHAFITRFNLGVGTDYEINEIDDNAHYVYCFDLETSHECETIEILFN